MAPDMTSTLCCPCSLCVYWQFNGFARLAGFVYRALRSLGAAAVSSTLTDICNLFRVFPTGMVVSSGTYANMHA